MKVLDQTITSLKKSKAEFSKNPSLLEAAIHGYWLMEFPVHEGRMAAERFFAPFLSNRLVGHTHERLFDSFLIPAAHRYSFDEIIFKLERACHVLESSSYYVE